MRRIAASGEEPLRETSFTAGPDDTTGVHAHAGDGEPERPPPRRHQRRRRCQQLCSADVASAAAREYRQRSGGVSRPGWDGSATRRQLARLAGGPPGDADERRTWRPGAPRVSIWTGVARQALRRCTMDGASRHAARFVRRAHRPAWLMMPRTQNGQAARAWPLCLSLFLRLALPAGCFRLAITVELFITF